MTPGEGSPHASAGEGQSEPRHVLDEILAGVREDVAAREQRVPLERVKKRAAEGACVLGLRFTADLAVPPERFDTLRRELGDAFIAVEIDSSPGNPDDIPKRAHSVLTNDLVDTPGHPTRVALDRVLDFFDERLKPRT